MVLTLAITSFAHHQNPQNNLNLYSNANRAIGSDSNSELVSSGSSVDTSCPSCPSCVCPSITLHPPPPCDCKQPQPCPQHKPTQCPEPVTCPSTPAATLAASSSDICPCDNYRISRSLLENYNGTAVLSSIAFNRKGKSKENHDDIVDYIRLPNAASYSAPVSQKCDGVAVRPKEPAVMVTSLGRRFFDKFLDANKFKNTIWQSPPPLPMWIVHENTWSVTFVVFLKYRFHSVFSVTN